MDFQILLYFICTFDGFYLREKRLSQILHSYGRSLVSNVHVRLVPFVIST